MQTWIKTVLVACGVLLLVAPTAAQENAFSLDLFTFVDLGGQRVQLFEPETVLLTHQKDFRMALWDAPMGRLHLELSLAQASLGSTGLVHGGRIDVSGIGLDALAYAPSGGLNTGQLFSTEYWRDLSTAEKIQAGVQVSAAAGVLYYVLDGLF